MDRFLRRTFELFSLDPVCHSLSFSLRNPSLPPLLHPFGPFPEPFRLNGGPSW